MPIGFNKSTLASKYDQSAVLLKQGWKPEENTHPTPPRNYRVHPITGEIIRDWEDAPEQDEDGSTIDTETTLRFQCQARPIITGGLNSQGTTERWTTKGSFEDVDIIEIHIPKDRHLPKMFRDNKVEFSSRDRITDIRDSNGNLIWKEADGTPTIFDIRGIAPSLDPFGFVVEYFAMLERSEIQGGKELGS